MGTVSTVRVLSAVTLPSLCCHSLHTPPPPPCPLSSRTSTWRARPGSISKSTWSCTPPTSTSMSAYFARDDIALHGFAKRFRANSTEEKEHAEKLIDYQIMRGGRVSFQSIAKPNIEEWGTAMEAVQASLELEKTVNESLLAMHKVADGHGDAQMTDFLEGTYLNEQVEAIKEIGDLITKMRRAGDGLGLHIIDKELQ